MLLSVGVDLFCVSVLMVDSRRNWTLGAVGGVDVWVESPL